MYTHTHTYTHTHNFKGKKENISGYLKPKT